MIRETPESPTVPYTSPAKVLLNGLGPDELLGGYGRYKTVFSQYGGWSRVVEEVIALSRFPQSRGERPDGQAFSSASDGPQPNTCPQPRQRR